MKLKLSRDVKKTTPLLYKQKSGWNSHCRKFFSEKIDFIFQFWSFFSLEIRFLSPTMFENVIVTSFVDRFSWFWYQWKEETIPYTMVPINNTLGPSISSSLGDGNYTPW